MASDMRSVKTCRSLFTVPAYDVEGILEIVDPDIRKPIDMMEILIRIVDGSAMEGFKPDFGKGMITAWARIHGTFNRVPHCNRLY